MDDPPRSQALGIDRIVDTARTIIERDGLGGLSMRKLGNELSVDPMAVYHHVPNKSSLLALVTERTIGEMETPDPGVAWDDWVRHWALGYWEIASSHRDLVLAGLADPRIGAGGLPATSELVAAVGRSGVAREFAEPSAYLVVDAVHGSALGVGTLDDRSRERAEARRVFAVELEVVVAGIAALATR